MQDTQSSQLLQEEANVELLRLLAQEEVATGKPLSPEVIQAITAGAEEAKRTERKDPALEKKYSKNVPVAPPSLDKDLAQVLSMGNITQVAQKIIAKNKAKIFASSIEGQQDVADSKGAIQLQKQTEQLRLENRMAQFDENSDMDRRLGRAVATNRDAEDSLYKEIANLNRLQDVKLTDGFMPNLAKGMLMKSYQSKVVKAKKKVELSQAIIGNLQVEGSNAAAIVNRTKRTVTEATILEGQKKIAAELQVNIAETQMKAAISNATAIKEAYNMSESQYKMRADNINRKWTAFNAQNTQNYREQMLANADLREARAQKQQDRLDKAYNDGELEDAFVFEKTNKYRAFEGKPLRAMKQFKFMQGRNGSSEDKLRISYELKQSSIMEAATTKGGGSDVASKLTFLRGTNNELIKKEFAADSNISKFVSKLQKDSIKGEKNARGQVTTATPSQQAANINKDFLATVKKKHENIEIGGQDLYSSPPPALLLANSPSITGSALGKKYLSVLYSDPKSAASLQPMNEQELIEGIATAVFDAPAGADPLTLKEAARGGALMFLTAMEANNARSAARMLGVPPQGAYNIKFALKKGIVFGVGEDIRGYNLASETEWERLLLEYADVSMRATLTKVRYGNTGETK